MGKETAGKIENPEIVHVQSVLLKDHAELLKERTGKDSIKDAIAKAINHYLNCKHAQED